MPACQARRRFSPERRPLSDIPAHQINQIFDCVALLSKRSRLRRNAITPPTALIEKVGVSEPAGTLRGLQGAPQANRIDITDIVLERLDIIYGPGKHAPVCLIVFEQGILAID